jgi:hypothetical protein
MLPTLVVIPHILLINTIIPDYGRISQATGGFLLAITPKRQRRCLKDVLPHYCPSTRVHDPLV